MTVREETRGLEEAGPRCGHEREYSTGGCRCELCKTAHQIKEARYRYRRKRREGRPLSRGEKAALARDLADDSGRLAYRWRPGGNGGGWVEEIITLPPARVILAFRAGQTGENSSEERRDD